MEMTSGAANSRDLLDIPLDKHASIQVSGMSTLDRPFPRAVWAARRRPYSSRSQANASRTQAADAFHSPLTAENDTSPPTEFAAASLSFQLQPPATSTRTPQKQSPRPISRTSERGYRPRDALPRHPRTQAHARSPLAGPTRRAPPHESPPDQGPPACSSPDRSSPAVPCSCATSSTAHLERSSPPARRRNRSAPSAHSPPAA